MTYHVFVGTLKLPQSNPILLMLRCVICCDNVIEYVSVLSLVQSARLNSTQLN